MGILANDSKVLHTGFETDRQTGAVSVPIQPASTFRLDPAGNHQGYIYSRSGNPTREAVENTIAVLEQGSRGLAAT